MHPFQSKNNQFEFKSIYASAPYITRKGLNSCYAAWKVDSVQGFRPSLTERLVCCLVRKIADGSVSSSVYRSGIENHMGARFDGRIYLAAGVVDFNSYISCRLFCLFFGVLGRCVSSAPWFMQRESWTSRATLRRPSGCPHTRTGTSTLAAKQVLLTVTGLVRRVARKHCACLRQKGAFRITGVDLCGYSYTSAVSLPRAAHAFGTRKRFSCLESSFLRESIDPVCRRCRPPRARADR
jgi:hypothetical protein